MSILRYFCKLTDSIKAIIVTDLFIRKYNSLSF